MPSVGEHLSVVTWLLWAEHPHTLFGLLGSRLWCLQLLDLLVPLLEPMPPSPLLPCPPLPRPGAGVDLKCVFLQFCMRQPVCAVVCLLIANPLCALGKGDSGGLDSTPFVLNFWVRVASCLPAAKFPYWRPHCYRPDSP